MANPYIRIEVFRHDEKDKSQEDSTAQLTDAGKKSAIEAGRVRKPKLNQGYVVASPRERAMHSAALEFFGPQFSELGLDKGDLKKGMETIDAHLKKEFKLGLSEKLSSDARLDFDFDSHPEYSKSFYGEYEKEAAENRTLRWQKDDSDAEILNLAKKTPEKDELAAGIKRIKGFSRMVGDIAEVLLEYYNKLDEWVELYNSKPESFDNEEMHIFVGTHSQNIECFLMKLIEIQMGSEFLEKLLNELPHGKSFIGYSEGFTISYFMEGEEIRILMKYKDFEWKLSKEVFMRLVIDRKLFDKEVENKLREDVNS